MEGNGNEKRKKENEMKQRNGMKKEERVVNEFMIEDERRSMKEEEREKERVRKEREEKSGPHLEEERRANEMVQKGDNVSKRVVTGRQATNFDTIATRDEHPYGDYTCTKNRSLAPCYNHQDDGHDLTNSSLHVLVSKNVSRDEDEEEENVSRDEDGEENESEYEEEEEGNVPRDEEEEENVPRDEEEEENVSRDEEEEENVSRVMSRDSNPDLNEPLITECSTTLDPLSFELNNLMLSYRSSKITGNKNDSNPVGKNSNPVTDNSDPVTDNSDPVTDNSDPVTDNSDPVTDNSDPVTDNSDPVMMKNHRDLNPVMMNDQIENALNELEQQLTLFRETEDAQVDGAEIIEKTEDAEGEERKDAKRKERNEGIFEQRKKIHLKKNTHSPPPVSRLPLSLPSIDTLSTGSNYDIVPDCVLNEGFGNEATNENFDTNDDLSQLFDDPLSVTQRKKQNNLLTKDANDWRQDFNRGTNSKVQQIKIQKSVKPKPLSFLQILDLRRERIEREEAEEKERKEEETDSEGFFLFFQFFFLFFNFFSFFQVFFVPFFASVN